MSAQICDNDVNHNEPIPDISMKTDLAIWVSSNCDLTNGAKSRLRTILDLKDKGLRMNLQHSCVQKPKVYISRKNFYQLLSQHKFYLAFENGYHCKEYVTEKLWINSYYTGAVPIVWGAAKEDYIRLTPPNSFIHYEDFKNPQELVNYLNYLDKNDTAYMEYFAWRKQYPCKFPLYQIHNSNERLLDEEHYHSQFFNAYCNLGKMLEQNLHISSKKIITSLNNFWFDPERPECRKKSVNTIL